MENIVVSGSFDNFKARDARFLQESARLGLVHVCLWSDRAVKMITGVESKFPQEERKYLLEAVRFVHKVWMVNQISSADELPQIDGLDPTMWVGSEREILPRNYSIAPLKI